MRKSRFGLMHDKMTEYIFTKTGLFVDFNSTIYAREMKHISMHHKFRYESCNTRVPIKKEIKKFHDILSLDHASDHTISTDIQFHDISDKMY